MARPKTRHSGSAYGEVTHGRLSATARLDREEALLLMRHIAEALVYGDEVEIVSRWGRRTPPKNLYVVDVRSV